MTHADALAIIQAIKDLRIAVEALGLSISLFFGILIGRSFLGRGRHG